MIFNLTQHAATAEQLAAGVVDFQGEALVGLKSLLTFDSLPTMAEVREVADKIAHMAYEAGVDIEVSGGNMPEAAMIGGAPFLMGALESSLKEYGFASCYAFSERVSEEQTQADGSVRKINVFKHVGFVWAE